MPRPCPRRVYPTLLASLVACLVLTATLLAVPAKAQGPSTRIGEEGDPVLAAIAINQAKERSPKYQGRSSVAVIGRSDVFADNLASTALAGTEGVLLFTDGGPDAPLRPEVAEELERSMVEGDCLDPEQGPTVYLAGGEQAVSQTVQDQLAGTRFCVQRLSGASRVQTAIAVADAVADPSDTVLLARSDDFADAGSVGSYAAFSDSRILITPGQALHPDVMDALQRMVPERIVLLGGEAALSAQVAQQAGRYATTVARVEGPARDGTATQIAAQLWGQNRSGDVALADGYEPNDWTYLFAGAAVAGLQRMPILYTQGDVQTPATRDYLAQNPPGSILLIGPGQANLQAASIGLQRVGTYDGPVMLKARPGTGELWVAEREGRIRTLGGDDVRTVLDISATVSTNGERGLLGFAFHPDGTQVFTSTTDNNGDSVIDAFDIVGDAVDPASRRQLIKVEQPASNHNGGDLHWGPDGYLWWSLGDGGGGGDTYRNGQNTQSLLGGLVRIDPAGGSPYAVPADNPFVSGGGAPELWAYGLRNPFRFSFDLLNGDLYIGDVGQSQVEEIDYLPAGTGAGSNFGWPIFEGTQPFDGGELSNHTPPVFEETHRAGNCSLTGGVVYRGSDIPDLYGAYLYSDLCRNSIRAITVEGGQVTASVDLGNPVNQPVAFASDHSGEVYVLGLGGSIDKLVAP